MSSEKTETEKRIETLGEIADRGLKNLMADIDRQKEMRRLCCDFAGLLSGELDAVIRQEVRRTINDELADFRAGGTLEELGVDLTMAPYAVNALVSRLIVRVTPRTVEEAIAPMFGLGPVGAPTRRIK